MIYFHRLRHATGRRPADLSPSGSAALDIWHRADETTRVSGAENHQEYGRSNQVCYRRTATRREMAALIGDFANQFSFVGIQGARFLS